MLRPLAFVAVRQEQHEAAVLAPLLLGRGDELIDDDLRAVHEVAELRFPQHERAGIGDGVAVLESEDAVFAEAASRRRRSSRPRCGSVAVCSPSAFSAMTGASAFGAELSAFSGT